MWGRERQRAVQLYRGQIPSPGRPTVAWREDRVRFWAAIARGVKTEDACCAGGVSGPVGFRWFRHAGGVNPCLPVDGVGSLPVVRRTGGHRALACPGTRRPRDRPAGSVGARRRSRGSCVAMRRPGPSGWTTGPRSRSGTQSGGRGARRLPSWSPTTRLRDYVQDRLSGVVRTADGEPWSARQARAWKGRNKPHRGDRRWVTAGARSRSRTAARSSSPMMSPCGSATRRSTRPSTSRAVARSSANWSPACAPDGRCGFPGHATDRKPGGHESKNTNAFAAPVLPQGHRPDAVDERGDPSSRQRTEQPSHERPSAGKPRPKH